WTNLNAINPNILGQAGTTEVSGNFPGAPVSNTWYPIALANKLAGTDLDSGLEDVDAQFNSGFANWYFGTDGHPAVNQIDFMSVVLHELGHGLGFFGSMNVSNPNDGNWGFGIVSPVAPAIFDRCASNGSST